MSINSLVLEEHYKQLHLDLGIAMLMRVTTMCYRQHDQKRRAVQIYAKTHVRRKKCTMMKLEKIRSAWTQETGDRKRGHTYKSSMAGPTVIPSTVEKGDDDIVPASTPYCQASCGNYGHQRRTSKLCTKHPRSKQYEGTYVV
jgi:hypothetical protein